MFRPKNHQQSHFLSFTISRLIFLWRTLAHLVIVSLSESLCGTLSPPPQGRGVGAVVGLVEASPHLREGHHSLQHHHEPVSRQGADVRFLQ